MSYDYLKYLDVNTLLAEVERLSYNDSNFTPILSILYDFKSYEEETLNQIYQIIDTLKKENNNIDFIIENEDNVS